jgi:arabinose-5-phosphate isomerase
MTASSRDFVFQTFQSVLTQETRSLETASENVARQYSAITDTCELIRNCTRNNNGRIIVSGIGKAGLIARKVAATLSSTGTPAVYLNAVDAMHGDLGIVRPGDVGLLFSYSGETTEIVRVAQELRHLSAKTICITKSLKSKLALESDVCIELGDLTEACPNGLAPSSSTTAMLAVGDAVALTVAEVSNFRPSDFARYHPAGSLGLQFKLVKDRMRIESSLVLVRPDEIVRHVIARVTKAKTAAAVLVRKDKSLIGIFTDGDLRRAILHTEKFLDEPIEKFASAPCKFVEATDSLAQALTIFRNNHIEELPVIHGAAVVGLLCFKDIELL